jgi:hypothetical protein
MVVITFAEAEPSSPLVRVLPRLWAPTCLTTTVGGRNPLSGGGWWWVVPQRRWATTQTPTSSSSLVLVPLVNKETGEIECVVLHLPEVVTRLDATLPVSEWAKN